jgi:two-component system chemotaxis response regulator CheB
MNNRLRILIVDDSALVRSALRTLLESDPEIEVVGEAANGREALQRAREARPNVITMDVRMPVMDGLETTEQLMAYTPTPILAITTLYSRDDIDISFKMLGAGALEVMEKPDLSSPGAFEHARIELIRRVKLLARVRVVTHLRGRRRTTLSPRGAHRPPDQVVSAHDAPAGRSPSAPPATEKKPRAPTPAETPPSTPPPQPQRKKKAADTTTAPRMRGKAHFPLVVIGASTGGPRIVQQILKGLTSPFDAAVVVVQHIAEGFSQGMVEWLANSSTLPVKIACEGERLTPGTVLIAPDSYHLYIQEKGIIHLDDQPMVQRPSVDIAMRTATEVFGANTTGVLLTGMGRDGAEGMQYIHEAGGYTIAQDEASCSIYGMPRAAVELDVVDVVLSPDSIILALQRRFGEGAAL